MASILKVDKLDPQSAAALEIGTSGDTISIPSGATLDISASTLTPPATMPASSGINLTALNATNLGSGTVPTARLGTGTASSTTILYGDQTYKTEPSSGISVYDAWSLTTGAYGPQSPIVNWTRQTAPLGPFGTGMTYSAGTFSFPETGYWHVTFHIRGRCQSTDDNQINAIINLTTNDSTYYSRSEGSTSATPTVFSSNGDWGVSTWCVFDVTEITNTKVRFEIFPGNTSTTDGTAMLNSTSAMGLTYVTFWKLGDT